MDEKWASITALITAYCRGYHATHDSPIIFDDFLAARLFTAEEHRTFDQQLAGQLKVINPERAAANPDQTTALASATVPASRPSASSTETTIFMTSSFR